MNSKPVLMIHEIEQEMFDLPLENYILTFDDGLYSQYYYWPAFQKINTEKIYFISSGCIAANRQSTNFPSCETAHQKAFLGNFEDYMTVEQIKELSKDPLVTIGCHGHFHYRLSEMPTLSDKIVYLNKDIEKMIYWFDENFQSVPRVFCYPHNDELYGIYKAMLSRLGFTDFYGKERIPIQKLY